MKNILFFVESLSGGGAEKVLTTLLRYLDSTNYQITLLVLVDTGVLREEIDTEKIRYLPIIRPSSNKSVSLWNKIKYKLIYFFLPARLVCRWIIPQKGFDLYVAFTEGFATKLLAFAPGPKLAWGHIDLISFPWTQDKHIFRSIQEEALAYQRFNRVICVSESVERAMILRYGLTRTQTILNPIDSEEIKTKANLDCGIILPNIGFRIVSVGRLSYQKGFDRLIPLIRKLRDNNLDVSLYLIGEGEEQTYLNTLTKENHLDGHVVFCGYQKNPYALMSQMDLFVCSSRAEGYSLVIAEALTLGLPVISTNCSGPDSLLDGGKYGVLCENDEELFLAMEKAVTDSVFLDKLREKSRNRSGFFNIRETVRQVEVLFDETICLPSAS